MAKTASKSYTYDERHKQFLEAGKKLVKGDDLSKVSAAAIARACKCTAPLVFAHFKDRDVLRNDVRKYVKDGKVTISKPTRPAPKKSPKPAPKVVKVIKTAAKKVTAVKKAGSPSASTSKKAAVKPAKSTAAKMPSTPAVAKVAAKKPAPVIVKPKKVSALAPLVVAAKLAPPPAPSNAE